MKAEEPYGKISLSLPLELLARLDEVAKREARSRSAQLRFVLSKELPPPHADEGQG